MKKILFAAMMFVLSFQTIAYCQNGSEALTNAVAKLKTLLTDHEIEKAYLHFDRPYGYYVAGNIVYFKAYVTMGERHEPSTISSVLHVDLINKNDVLMQPVALQLTNGTGWGDFALPDTLQKGTYRIRAWTQWMRNDKTPYFFDQFISVSSVNGVDQVSEAAQQGASPSLQFFPEGGNLVVDIHSKVAFKAIGGDGLGVNVKGVVVDNENKEVAKIVSAHLGMGVFDFIPEEGRTYKAKVTFANGSQSTQNLPPAEEKGILLAVNTDDPGKVAIVIKANRAYYKENQNKQLNLLVYYAGALKRYAPKLDGEVLGLDLPASTFHTGVIQVTLMSETGEPLSERLAFIQNPDLLNLGIAPNKTSFGKRENVQLNLSAKNKDGNPVAGSFSVSVIDESKILVDENTGNTILSYLLLSSELKGYIEKPNYYFANVSKETRANLDALMLTQGYRRFTWKKLLNDNTPAIANAYTPEKYIDVSGTLKTKAGEPIPACNVTLLSETGGIVLSQETDAAGRFRFTNLQVFETGTKFILKAQGSLAKKAVLTMDKQAPGPEIDPGNAIEARYNANADILASLENNHGQGLVTAGTGSAKQLLADDKVIGPKRTDNYRSSSLLGPGHADQLIMGDEVKDYTALDQALSGIALGITFNGGVPSSRLNMTIGNGGEGSESMLVVVDGVELPGYSIDNIPPGAVEAIEIFKGPSASIYGMAGGAGVMVITTRQGGLSEVAVSKEMSPGIFSIQPVGYYKAREFYSPKYDAAKAADKAPDNRTTIFWKPDVNTDASGNALVSFFNADGTGSYRVEVEGFDSQGNLGRQVFRYQVQ